MGNTKKKSKSKMKVSLLTATLLLCMISTNLTHICITKSPVEFKESFYTNICNGMRKNNQLQTPAAIVNRDNCNEYVICWPDNQVIGTRTCPPGEVWASDQRTGTTDFVDEDPLNSPCKRRLTLPSDGRCKCNGDNFRFEKNDKGALEACKKDNWHHERLPIPGNTDCNSLYVCSWDGDNVYRAQRVNCADGKIANTSGGIDECVNKFDSNGNEVWKCEKGDDNLWRKVSSG